MPQALDIALRGAATLVDLGRAHAGGESRWFGSAAGVGFDALVAAAMAGKRRAWQRGRLGYLSTTLNELRRARNRPVRIRAEGDDGATAHQEHTVLLAVVANGAYYGGGMRIAPDARADDGLLDVCVVGDISRMTALRELPNLYRGTHVRHPAVSMHTAVTIDVEGSSATRVHLDGEPFGSLPLAISLLPRAIEVAVAEPSARL